MDAPVVPHGVSIGRKKAADYAIGALSASAVADTFRLVWAIKLAAVLSLISGEAVGVVMRQTANR